MYMYVYMYIIMSDPFVAAEKLGAIIFDFTSKGYAGFLTDSSDQQKLTHLLVEI